MIIASKLARRQYSFVQVQPHPELIEGERQSDAVGRSHQLADASGRLREEQPATDARQEEDAVVQAMDVGRADMRTRGTCEPAVDRRGLIRVNRGGGR